MRDLGEVDVNSGVVFPFLFGGTFIEGVVIHSVEFLFRYFPSFSEGLSLRAKFAGVRRAVVNFPSFSEGLSLRGTVHP